jgi:hypothetical protein
MKKEFRRVTLIPLKYLNFRQFLLISKSFGLFPKDAYLFPGFSKKKNGTENPDMLGGHL